MGMGLAISHSIISNHGGEMKINHQYKDGAEIHVSPYQCNAYSQRDPSPMKPNQTVYIIDDDSDVADSMSMLLESTGLRTQQYHSAEEFLKNH